MPNTFTLIASSTVGSGGAASIDFTSIPSTYTDLLIKISVRSDYAARSNTVQLNINGSAISFTSKDLYGSGSAAASFSGTVGIGAVSAAASTSNTFANSEVYIPNYAGSNNKSYSVDSVQEDNQTEAYADLVAGLLSNTAAITSLSIKSNVGSFVQYSTAYLYGIVKS
jgi:hypothetical protein